MNGVATKQRGDSSRKRSNPLGGARAYCALGALLCALAIVANGGCARYRFGACTLFPADVHTVYVPVFESASFRRGLGERLTEAVVKEIERRSGYKVVGTADADSILTGKIVGDRKNVIIDGPTDEPREFGLNYRVEVTWADRRGNVLAQRDVPLTPQMVMIGQGTSVIPEVGESVAVGQQEAFDRLARQVVSLMEAPW